MWRTSELGKKGEILKVLVSGGAGFIGSQTVDLLQERGYEVRILDGLFSPVHLNRKKPSYVPEDAEFTLGDVRNKNDWEKALKEVDVVFHLAAYQDYLTDFSKFFQVNSVGTALLYEVIVERNLPVKKVIIGSSQAIYGEGNYRCPEDGTVYPDLRSLEQLQRGDWEVKCPECGGKIKMQLTDESRVNPQNQYAISKYSQELTGLNLGKRYKIPTVCLRYSIVQGPRQSFYNLYSGALRTFSLSVYFKKRPVIYEDGLQLRDYVNIEDVVRANLLVMEDPRGDYQVYNVGGGKAYTVLELASTVRRAFGDEVNPRIAGEFRFGDTRHIVSDISKIKTLGWKPINSVEKSVSDYVAWLKGNHVVQDLAEYTQKKMKDQSVVRKAKV